MRTATHLQLFRFKYVTLVQQEYHKNISSSRGFCRFFERKCKKTKISRSEIVSQVQQVHPRYREFVTSVLHFTVFRIVSSHLTCCILFFYTFPAMFFMRFSVCLLAYMHISKCNRLNQDPVNLLRLCCTSPFSGLFRHTLRVAFYFSTLFLQCFSCIFPYVYSLTCIFQSITDFCVRFFRPTPLPQPFSGLQPAFGCTFCNKKQHRQPFQGHLCCAVFLT